MRNSLRSSRTARAGCPLSRIHSARNRFTRWFPTFAHCIKRNSLHPGDRGCRNWKWILLRREAVESRFTMNDKKNERSQDEASHTNLAQDPGTSNAVDGGISRRGVAGPAGAPLVLVASGRHPPPAEAGEGIPFGAPARDTRRVSLICVRRLDSVRQ